MHNGKHSSSNSMVAQFEGTVRGPVRRSVTPVVADADADGHHYTQSESWAIHGSVRVPA